MKGYPAALLTHLGGSQQTVAFLWVLTARNGDIRRWTSFDSQLLVGGDTYTPDGGMDMNAVQSREGAAITNIDIEGTALVADPNDSGITEFDIFSGRWAGANIAIYSVNYEDTSQLSPVLYTGQLGQLTLANGKWTSQARSIAERLERGNVLRDITRTCPAVLGDAECTLDLDPDIWLADTAYDVGAYAAPPVYNGKILKALNAGTSDSYDPDFDAAIDAEITDNDITWLVSRAWIQTAIVLTVTSRRIFTVAAPSIGPAPTGDDDWFAPGGLVTFLSGENLGLSKEIVGWDSGTAEVTLFEEMWGTIEPGDLIEMQVGDDHNAETCIVKFDNFINNQGFKDIPVLGDMAKQGSGGGGSKK